MSIAENIRSARKAAGLKQQQLAEMAGISKGAVQYAERQGGNEPGIPTLRKLSIALNVSLSTLLGEDLSGEALRIGEMAERLQPEDKAFVVGIIKRLEAV